MTATVTSLPCLEMKRLADGVEVESLIILGDGSGQWHKGGQFVRAATPEELEEAKRAFWGITG